MPLGAQGRDKPAFVELAEQIAPPLRSLFSEERSARSDVEHHHGYQVAVRDAEELGYAVMAQRGVERDRAMKEFRGAVRAGFRPYFREDDGTIGDLTGLRIRKYVTGRNEVMDVDRHKAIP